MEVAIFFYKAVVKSADLHASIINLEDLDVVVHLVSLKLLCDEIKLEKETEINIF